MELQQRGVEYGQLFGKFSHLRSALLERMPPLEVQKNNANGGHNGHNDLDSEEDLMEGNGRSTYSGQMHDKMSEVCFIYILYLHLYKKTKQKKTFTSWLPPPLRQ